jgi:hypothetical protein
MPVVGWDLSFMQEEPIRTTPSATPSSKEVGLGARHLHVFDRPRIQGSPRVLGKIKFGQGLTKVMFGGPYEQMVV